MIWLFKWLFKYFCLTRAFYCLKVIFVINVNFCALLEVEAINKPWYFNVWIISQQLTTTTGGSGEESGCFTEGTVKEFQLGLIQSWYKCNWSLCSFQKPIGLIQLCYNFKTLPLTFKSLSVKDLKESRFFVCFLLEIIIIVKGHLQKKNTYSLVSIIFSVLCPVKVKW